MSHCICSAKLRGLHCEGLYPARVMVNAACREAIYGTQLQVAGLGHLF